MASKSPIPYGRQIVDSLDINAVIKVLKSDWITQGSVVPEFENGLAKLVNAKYAICVSNGTVALHAACLAAGISFGDEVIVPALSFIATANCVIYCGAKPVLVDVYDDTLTINVEDIEKKINKKTKAIIAVDFAGHPASWNKLKAISKKYKLVLIDDAAHALGSTYNNKPIGSIADITTFSFHPVKIITSAEGGAVTTNYKNFYKIIRKLRNHGMVKSKSYSKKYGQWYYHIESLGYNWRMTEMQAALGLSQLKKVKQFIKRRREIVSLYNEAFTDLPIITPKEIGNVVTAWHLYPIRLKLDSLKSNRKKIFDFLKQNGLGIQVHYIPIHFHTLYKNKFGYKKGDFPISEQIYMSEISLPLFPKLTNANIKKVIKIVKDAFYEF